MKPTETELHQIAVARYEDSIYPFNDKVEAFKDGFNEAISQMQPEWVACSERLPYFDKRMLAWDCKKKKWIIEVRTVSAFIPNDWTWSSSYKDHITQWMPLPNPPKSL